MQLSVRHVTRYVYDAPARYAIQTLRLTPPSFEGQSVTKWSLTAPGIDDAIRFTDGFGNVAALVATAGEHSAIEIVAEGIVETQDHAGIVRGLAEMAPPRVFMRETAATKPDAAIRELAASVPETGELDRLHALMHRIRDEIDYETGTTDAQTTAAEVLAQGRGVCQDHAHLFISAARCQGMPARYVNGYFLSGAVGPEPAHHAWAEVMVPGLGWVGFDVANRVCPDDRYVRLVTGLDAESASPIRGRRPMAGDSSEVLTVAVDVHEQQAMQQSQSQSQS